jgi:DNA-binding MarR family transcriptional regulator
MNKNEEVAEDIRKIRWHQEAIDKNMELLTRAHRKEIMEEIKDFFGLVPKKKKAINRAKIFLAIDGKRTVSDLASFLNLPISYISQEITKLKGMSLIEVKKATKTGIIYKKTRANSILRISLTLKKKFGFTES